MFINIAICDAVKDNVYDLIFLDIEMPAMNGIEVANYIFMMNWEILLLKLLLYPRKTDISGSYLIHSF